MKIISGLFLCSVAIAQIEQPRLGIMLDRASAARPVFGLPASATLGDPAASRVLSLGCSTFCLIKTASSIASATGSVDAPPGPALFSFSADSALVYFPRTREFARWRNNRLEPIALPLAGNILAVGSASFVVRRPGAVWIVNSFDQPIDSLPLATTSALLLDSGVLYSTSTQLILRRADQSEQSFAISHILSLSWLAPDYAQIRTLAFSYALRLTPGHERLFLLPEPE